MCADARHGENVAVAPVEEFSGNEVQVREQVMDLIRPNPPTFADSVGTAGDWTLPVSAVALAAIVIAIVGIVAVGTFRARVADAQSDLSTFLSGEGLVLAEFRRQTEAELREKDRTILAALNRLRTLESEQTQLEELVENRVARREAELTAELEERLAAERARLEEAGASETAVAERVSEIRAEEARDLARTLSNFRTTVEADVSDRATDLLFEEAATRSSLEQATAERTALVDQATVTRRALERGYPQALATVDAASPTGTGTNPALDDELRRELASAERRTAELEIQVTRLERQLDALHAAIDADTGDRELAGELSRLRGEYAAIEDRLGNSERREQELRLQVDRLSAENQTLGLQIDARRPGVIAEQARTQALRDVVDAVDGYDEVADPTVLGERIGVSGVDRALAESLIAKIGGLIAEAQRRVLDARLEFRAIGTVSLAGSGSVVVQRLVTATIAHGDLAEIRRGSGEVTVVVGRGEVTSIEPQRFTVAITNLSTDALPAVGDRVFVALPR